MNVVILERNKLVGRRVARQFMAAGATAVAVEEPRLVAGAVAGADALCADTFDADVVVEQVRARPGLRGVLWTAEPLRRSLRYVVEAAATARGPAGAIDHVLARRDFESAPRAWELLMLARRLCAGPGGGPPPPLAGYLDWGAEVVDVEIRATADRDAAAARAQDLVGALAVPRRLAELVGELVHELVMNAIYDAPVDAAGHPRYAADRKAAVVLAEHERALLRLGTDGTRLAVQLRDPFGRLERRHVFDGLARGLASGEQDRSGGGAGLGLAMCHHASSVLVFDVARGRHTEVTALVELDQSVRDLRGQARSLHFWSR